MAIFVFIFMTLPSGPLATLAGVYQDVKGQKLESMWTKAVLAWTEGLVNILHIQLDNPHLRLFSQTGVSALTAALDVVRKINSNSL